MNVTLIETIKTLKFLYSSTMEKAMTVILLLMKFQILVLLRK